MSETPERSIFELLEEMERLDIQSIASGDYSPSLNLERVPYLLSAIFGVSKDAPWPPPPPAPSMAAALAEAAESVLVTLSPREEKIIKMRFGLEKDGQLHTQKEVASHFAVTAARVKQIESKALKKLRHPSRARLLREFLDEASTWTGRAHETPAELIPVVETVKQLTPGLIRHLKTRESDLTKIHWKVFEHLVAEFLAQRGFSDVRLVGTNAKTGADIYAVLRVDQIGIEHRYFIEVKRWKDKVGVEVIDRVYGAFLAERERMGWHAAIIVSAVGFKDIKKYSPYQLKMMGVELKDKGDLLRWLKEYEQREDGLWLPKPPTLSI
jgi:RNA polymerase sigma factor (sigma-70 family)